MNSASAKPITKPPMCAAYAMLEPWSLDTEPNLTDVCKDGTGPFHFWNCSAQQLAICESYYCSDCSWTQTESDCPNGF